MKNLRLFIRFAAVGALATLVDIAVTLALVPWVAHFLWANTAGFMIANLMQFIVVHHWVFGQSLRLDWHRAYIASLGISTLGLLLSNTLVWLLVGVGGLDLVMGKLAAALASLILNYGLRRTLLYARTT